MLADLLKTRLGRQRPRVSVTLRMPPDVLDSLKAIAPMKGHNGYRALLKT